MAEFTAYKVALQVHDRLMGGVPKSASLIDGWLDAIGQGSKDSATKAEMGLSVEEVAEKEQGSWTGFKSCDVRGQEIGLYIEGRQIRGLLKEAARVTSTFQANRGLGTFTQMGVWCEPKAIMLRREGKPIMQPDGPYESVSHINGPQGPRSALKRRDYVLAPVVEFHVIVVNKVGGKLSPMTGEILRDLFVAGEMIGIGTDRTQDEGKYSLIQFEEDPTFTRFRLPNAV